MDKKPPTLEDRVRALEGFRYRMLGQINATRTLLFAAWHQLLKHHAEFRNDPVEAVKQMRTAWLQSSETTARPFPGTDPVHLDAINQEYRKAIEELTQELGLIAVGLAREQRAKGGK